MGDFEPERSPCAQCGEPIALSARICPHCRQSALVDLAVDGAPADGRQRYQAARALSALGAPFPALTAATEALSGSAPVARGLTRAQADAAGAALQPLGVRTRLLPAAAPSGGARMRIAAGAVAAVVVAGLAVWIARPSQPRPLMGPVAIRTAEAPSGMAGIPAAGGRGTPELPRPQLVKLALASTASVRCRDSVGAGFYVGGGMMLTNAHVLCADGEPVRVVMADGRETSGHTVRRDDDVDLALVNAGGIDAPALALGDASALSAGDRVLLAGSPVGMDFTVHEGMISAMGRVLLGTSYIQLDAKVNPGNSGGPLLDTRGRVVGIVSLKRRDAEGIALALPINYAYAGDAPMVPPPAGVSPAGFEAMLAKARDEDERLAGTVASQDMKPLLAGLTMNEQREFLAEVLYPSRSQPLYLEFSFKVWSGATELCSMKTSVNEWKSVQTQAQDNPRAAAWLQKHSLRAQLYYGVAPLRLDLCPRDQMRPGVQLELIGADESAARLSLQ